MVVRGHFDHEASDSCRVDVYEADAGVIELQGRQVEFSSPMQAQQEAEEIKEHVT